MDVFDTFLSMPYQKETKKKENIFLNQEKKIKDNGEIYTYNPKL